MADVCRLCLNDIPSIGQYSNNRYEKCNVSIESKILFLMPEIDLQITSTVALCSQCLESLNSAYTFKCKCIQTEEVIKTYCSKYQEVNLKYIQDLKSSDIGNSSYNEVIKLEELHLDKEDISVTIGIDDMIDIKTEPTEVYIIKNDVRSFEQEDLLEIQSVTHNDPISKEEHNRFVYKCIPCNQIFVTRRELIEHNKKIHSTLAAFSCKICNKIIRSKYGYELHMSLHGKIMHCPICKKVCTSQKVLQAHILKHSEQEKKYNCKTCKRSFFNKSSFKRHQQTIHLNERNYACEVCHKIFKHSSHCKRHMLRVHIGMKSECPSITCEVCGLSCSSKYALKEHIRTHTGERPYICKICGKAFAQGGTLGVHVRSVHKKERPYVCETCGKTFAGNAYLKLHIETQHTKNVEKKFVCSQCGKSFSVKSKLQLHLNGHLGIKSQQCPICGKALSGTTKLEYHLRIHTGEKPFECELCHKNFNRKDNLKTHYKSHKPKALK